jgi:hypothetical protein
MSQSAKATLTMRILPLVARIAIPSILLVQMNLAQAQIQTPEMGWDWGMLQTNVSECLRFTSQALEEAGLRNFSIRRESIFVKGEGFAVLLYCIDVGYGQTLSSVIVSSPDSDLTRNIERDLTLRIYRR